MEWEQTGVTADAALAGDAAAGKAQAAVCAACHGPDGNSAVPSFPKLAGQGEKYLYKQLKDIRDGARPIPTMAGQLDGKSNQELADIASYFASQTMSGGHTDPALLALGESVYRSGIPERKVAACAACHSPTGAGNAPAGFPALAGQQAEYIAAQPTARAMRMKPAGSMTAIPVSCVSPRLASATGKSRRCPATQPGSTSPGSRASSRQSPAIKRVAYVPPFLSAFLSVKERQCEFVVSSALQTWRGIP